MAAIEREALATALAANGGNQKRTAAYLGLAYHQLRNLLRKHAIGGGDNATISPQSDDNLDAQGNSPADTLESDGPIRTV